MVRIDAYGIIVVKRKITANLAVIFLEVVDLNGIEPSTSRMRTERSPMRERTMRPQGGANVIEKNQRKT